MIIVITGRPGIGKTTVFTKIVENVRRYGFVVGGIVCPEVRVNNVRVGFKIVNLMSGEEGWLAKQSINCRPELRVSKYCIEVRDVLSVGVKALTDAIASADIICIDEVGPMELRVKELRNAIVNALRSSKNVLAVIHWRLDDRGIVELVKSAIKYEVNIGNRDILPNIISDILLRSLSSSKT